MSDLIKLPSAKTIDEFLAVFPQYIQSLIDEGGRSGLQHSRKWDGDYMNVKISFKEHPMIPSFIRLMQGRIIKCEKYIFRVSNYWEDSMNAFIVLWRQPHLE